MRAYSFKMLRVLDLTVLDYNGSVPSDIIDVVLLRYLALASNRLLTSIPLWKNWNLQTLIICEDINGVCQLPRGIWELPQLRHLQLYHQLIPMYTPEVAPAQVNLQTMYWLQCIQCTEHVLSRIPNSVFLKATSLHIPHADNSRYWRWARYSGHKVAVLLGVCWLEIKGKLDTRRLHKITSYSAYLIFKLRSEPQRLDTAFTSVRYIKDKRSCSENRRCQVFLAKRRSSEDPGRFPNRRHDGWMEIKLGDFYISSRNEDEVEMRLWSTENVHWKSGLIVKGIEVRPN
nr:F-box protein PP2-B11-like [Ipomoea batatas]